jgi:outer membrane protein TolC
VVQSRIAQAEAGTRGALAKFDGTVLTALRETETALGNYARELDRRAALEASRDQSAIVARRRASSTRTAAPATSSRSTPSARWPRASRSLAASEAQLSDDQVVLFMALGGGWEPEDTNVAQGASPDHAGHPATSKQ